MFYSVKQLVFNTCKQLLNQWNVLFPNEVEISSDSLCHLNRTKKQKVLFHEVSACEKGLNDETMTETSNRAKCRRAPSPSVTLWGESSRNPDTFIKRGISPGRQRRANRPPPPLPARPWHRHHPPRGRMDGLVTQCAPPPANHSLQRHGNGPHYLQLPYGEMLMCVSPAPPSEGRLRRGWGASSLVVPPLLQTPSLWMHCRGWGGGSNEHLLFSPPPHLKKVAVRSTGAGDWAGGGQGLIAIVWTVPRERVGTTRLSLQILKVSVLLGCQGCTNWWGALYQSHPYPSILREHWKAGIIQGGVKNIMNINTEMTWHLIRNY